MSAGFTYRLLWLFQGYLFFILPAGVDAQVVEPHHIQLFDYTYGIRSGSIIGLDRDREGFLWILYPRSVQRFDGKEEKTYRLGNTLTGVLCDKSGDLWVYGTENVWRYHSHGDRFVPVPMPEQALGIGVISQVEDGTIYMICRRNVYRYQPDTGFTEVRLPAQVQLPLNARACAAWGDHLFLAGPDKVYRLHQQSNAVDSLDNRAIMHIYPLASSRAIVSTWNLSSFWYDFDSGEITEAVLPPEFGPVDAPVLSIRDLISINPSTCLITAHEGVLYCDPARREFSEFVMYMDGHPVTKRDFGSVLAIDTSGVIWMATIDGVARIPLRNQTFGLKRLTRSADPVGLDNVRSIVADNRNGLWLGTGDGFANWNRTTDKVTIYASDATDTAGLSYPSIRGILWDGRYVILGPADRGVWMFDPLTTRYRRPVYADEEVRHASESDFFDAITLLRNGDIFFPGRDDLYVLRHGTYRLEKVNNAASHENGNYAVQSRSGDVWLTTMHGLHVLNDSLEYQTAVPLPPGAGPISSCLLLPDDSFLFACDGMLYQATLEQGDVTITTYTDRFAGIQIASMFLDDKGILWIASENGIYRFDQKQARMNLFDYTDNVQGYGFNGNCVFQAPDGTVFLGGINGLNYFNPDQFGLPDSTLRVSIQDVRNGLIDSLEYPLSGQATLPFGYRSLEVSCVAPYFNNADKVSYRYRIRGLDDKWISNGNNRRIRLSAIPPGSYTLEVAASINQVDWFPAEENFRFRILTPFWMRWWFVGGLILVLLSWIWWMIRKRDIRFRKKQEELEIEQALHQLSNALSSNLRLPDLMQKVAETCVRRLHCVSACIALVEEEDKTWRVAGSHGLLEIHKIDEKEDRIVATVLDSGLPMTNSGSDLVPDDARAVIPISIEGRVIGLIDCRHSEKGFFTQNLLSALGSIASLCAVKIVRVKAEEEKMESERILRETKQQMADAEMQALRAQMNPHFIFNCLNSINRYIVKSDQATASLYLTRFAKLIRLILDNSNNKTVTLTNEIEALRLYIEMESIRFEKKFSYAITVDPNVHADHVFVPPLIIQPYVENAIWHGLLHKDTEGVLKIHLARRAPALLECTIEDNGIGRERARELKSKSATQNKSLGMRLTENRLALLSQYHAWEAAVEIRDLADTEGVPCGTQVLLRIPVDDWTEHENQ